MSCCQNNDALMVDSNGCFICDSPKVKGRFGLAWVSESPDCPCPEPTGWQVEFLDTPSKVEQKCQEMVRWINCPPLPRCDPCPPDELCCPTNPPRCNPCAPKCNPCLPTCCPLPKCTCKPPPPPCCCKLSPCCCKKERKKEKRSCCCSCRPKRNCYPPMGGPCCRNRSPRKRSPQRCCCSDEQELPKCTCDDIPVKDTNNGVNASSSGTYHIYKPTSDLYPYVSQQVIRTKPSEEYARSNKSANTLTIYKNRNQYNTDTDNCESSEGFVHNASSTCPQTRHSRKTLNSCDCKSGYNSVEPSRSYGRPRELYSCRRISEDLIMDERRPLVQQESCQCSLYQSDLYGTNSRTYVNVDTSYSRSRFITESRSGEPERPPCADDYYSACVCAESGQMSRRYGGSSRQVCTCNSVVSGEYKARPSRSVDDRNVETYGRSSRKDVYERSFHANEQSSRTIDNRDYKETVACSCKNERSSRSIDKDACPCRNFELNDRSSRSVDNYKDINDRSSRSIDNRDFKDINDRSSRSVDNRLCTNKDIKEESSRSIDKERFCNADESKDTKEQSSGETVEPFDEHKTCRPGDDDVKPDDSNSQAEKDASNEERPSSEEVAVVPQFLVQGGDIGAQNKWGSIYGGAFKDENFLLSHDVEGAVGMANDGPDTNMSQFYITTVPCTHLDSINVVFGYVRKGLNIIREMQEVPRVNDKPQLECTIVDCGEIPPGGKLHVGELDETGDVYPPWPDDYDFPADVDVEALLTAIKDSGNYFYRQSNFVDSDRKYKKVLRYVEWITRTNLQHDCAIVREIKLLTLLNLAGVRLKKQKYKDVVDICSQVLDLDPKNGKALYRRGQARLKLKDYDKSIGDLQMAMARFPKNKAINTDYVAAKKMRQSYLQEERLLCSKMFQ